MTEVPASTPMRISPFKIGSLAVSARPSPPPSGPLLSGQRSGRALVDDDSVDEAACEHGLDGVDLASPARQSDRLLLADFVRRHRERTSGNVVFDELAVQAEDVAEDLPC